MTPHQESLSFPATCVCGNPDCQIPFGYCHCECGEKVHIPDRTFGNWIKGRPQRFARGHRKPHKGIIEEALPFKIDGVYCRLIPLTQGQHVIVWASDYEWLMQWKWHARWNDHSQSYYATRQMKIENGNTRQISVHMHRVILGLEFGDPRIGDHKNHVTLDCRRDNLRVTDDYGSMKNRRMQRSSSTGFKGVSKRIGKHGIRYSSTITVDGVRINLGVRDDPREAHELYCEASRRLHGEFSRVC